MRVLTIAGSDPSGGAGIQADLAVFGVLGCRGMAVPAALTAQGSGGVRSVHVPPAVFFSDQLDAVLEEYPPKAVKTGMLATAQIVEVAASRLSAGFAGPLVVDPVLRSTSGTPLLAADALAVLRTRLLPLAALVTPNLPELRELTGLGVDDVDGAGPAVAALFETGVGAVLVKGGHDGGTVARDVLWLRCTPQPVTFDLPRLQLSATHGTGCALSAAITARLALGDGLVDAVRAAKRLLHDGLRRGAARGDPVVVPELRATAGPGA